MHQIAHEKDKVYKTGNKSNPSEQEKDGSQVEQSSDYIHPNIGNLIRIA